MDDDCGGFVDPDANQCRALHHRADQTVVALAPQEVLIDERLAPEPETFAITVFCAVSPFRSASPVIIDSAITAAPALVPPTTAPA